MSFYVYETQHEPVKHARTCDKCGKGMNEGYLNELSDETFCSEDCTIKKLGRTKCRVLMTFSNLFWTTWHDEVEGLA